MSVIGGVLPAIKFPDHLQLPNGAQLQLSLVRSILKAVEIAGSPQVQRTGSKRLGRIFACCGLPIYGGLHSHSVATIGDQESNGVEASAE